MRLLVRIWIYTHKDVDKYIANKYLITTMKGELSFKKWMFDLPQNNPEETKKISNNRKWKVCMLNFQKLDFE